MYLTLLIIQHLAIAALAVEIFYIAALRPSKYQVDMLLLLLSTFIMLGGYSIELFAQSAETALMGAAIAYVGKPFALIMSFTFIADYYGKPISKRSVYILGAVGSLFPIIVFTNGYQEGIGHHLYYATVDFDINRKYSPLILTRGPLYYTYMIFLIVIFIIILYYIILTAKKNRNNKEALHQVNYLAVTIVATIIGYVIYLSGITSGYDTTMTGAAIGTFSISILFIKYHLFDYLTLAKEQALHDASTGLLVFNDFEESVYINAVAEKLISSSFNEKEFKSLSFGNHIIHRLNNVYEIQVSEILNSGRVYGKTIEITDITEKFLYNLKLENEVEERTKDVRKIQQAIIIAFAGLVEARDDSTGQHIRRMAKNTELIARQLMHEDKHPSVLSEDYIDVLVEVAPLHDLGKLVIPDNILQKPGKLTEMEYRLIKNHTSEGAKIIIDNLTGVESPIYVKLASNVAKNHHEWWDGSGYPDGLKGTKIPLSARIVSVADVYDAIRSERCYKPAMSKEEAKNVILEGRGTQFDPDIVDAFLKIHDEIDKQYK